ncbi:MAG: hypothetical protein EOM26_02130 [Alphaproteobacteria bacterium]|nr:hypothetical protein [Alphaproteobacteria bacterium]
MTFSNPRNIALVIGDIWPLDAETAGLARELRALGYQTSCPVWSDTSSAWARFDFVVIRSTWGYHNRPVAYRRWLRDMAGRGIPLANSPALVAWNLHKRYLFELEKKGVPIVPTVLLRAGLCPAPAIRRVLADHRAEHFVLKPAISASAEGTVKLLRQDLTMAITAYDCDMLLQPLLPEIATTGEVSLIFIEGAFSHAVCKHPAPGDFRVQKSFGGRAKPIRVTEAQVKRGQAVLEALPEIPLYARVDGIFHEDRLLLMELELNEPSLYLSSERGATNRFATAIIDRMEQTRLKRPA